MVTNSSDKSTWLHLGAGAFHRAHQSWYLNQLRDQGETSWSLTLANIRNSATQQTLQQLADQQGRYTLEIISPEGQMTYQPITAIEQVILWDSGLKTLINVGADSATKIISFTVTEGGYFLDDEGHLNTDDRAIQADLAEEDETSTLYGALVKILRARMQQNGGAVTLLNCDNLRNNGDSFYRGLLEFVSEKNDPDLLAWIKQHTSAPNSMVDRITPKFDEAIYSRLEQQGITDDRVPLCCEAFSQWVIEDNFIAGRPALEQVGVEFVDDVTPFEEAKIRILNASHSGIAWAGSLLGYQYIDQSLTPQVQQWIRDYVLQDVVPCLEPAQFNLEEYCDTTLNRFSNRWVRDTNQRVSSDSIAKLHEFIVPTLKARFQQHQQPDATLVLTALFFLFMQQRHQGKLAFDYQDRAIDSLSFEEIYNADDPLRAFASSKKLFGSLAGKPEFIDRLAAVVEQVKQTIVAEEKTS